MSVFERIELERVARVDKGYAPGFHEDIINLQQRLSKVFSRTIDETTLRQQQLLDDLLKTGVEVPIREVVGDINNKAEQLGRIKTGNWTAVVLPPELQGTGTWNPDLRINFLQNMFFNLGLPEDRILLSQVELIYSPNRKLRVSGVIQEFGDYLTTNPRENITNVEFALAKVIHYPKLVTLPKVHPAVTRFLQGA